jgi:MFS family permease
MTFYSFPDKSLPHSKNRHVLYHPRLKWGLAWTLSFATLYSVWAGTVASLQHRTYFPQYHISIWGIIAAYYVASIVAGVALGFLYFLADHRWGAPVLGFLLGFVFYAVCGVAMFGFHTLSFLVAFIPGALIGTGAGLVIYDDEHKMDLPAGATLTRDQKPLLIAGIFGFGVFFAATQLGVGDYVLYALAAHCIALPLGVWIFLRRAPRSPTRSSSHAT